MADSVLDISLPSKSRGKPPHKALDFTDGFCKVRFDEFEYKFLKLQIFTGLFRLSGIGNCPIKPFLFNQIVPYFF